MVWCGKQKSKKWNSIWQGGPWTRLFSIDFLNVVHPPKNRFLKKGQFYVPKTAGRTVILHPQNAHIWPVQGVPDPPLPGGGQFHIKSICTGGAKNPPNLAVFTKAIKKLGFGVFSGFSYIWILYEKRRVQTPGFWHTFCTPPNFQMKTRFGTLQKLRVVTFWKVQFFIFWKIDDVKIFMLQHFFKMLTFYKNWFLQLFTFFKNWHFSIFLTCQLFKKLMR